MKPPPNSASLMKAKPPTSFREAIKLLGQALDLRHAKPKLVKDGPCKEVIHNLTTPPSRTSPESWPRIAGCVDRRLITSSQAAALPLC